MFLFDYRAYRMSNWRNTHIEKEGFLFPCYASIESLGA